MKQLLNVMPRANGAFQRIGYRSIWGAMWMLFKANRICRKTGVKTEIRIMLPIR